MPQPVLTLEQMRAWEAASWAAGRNPTEVIDTVGRLVARRLLALSSPGQAILLLAGKGHNGDDVRATARHLTDRQVTLLEVLEPQQARETVLGLAPQDWVVDGLFGIGLNRPLNREWQQLIETINARAWPVLAVDLPSGLNADTGLPQPIAIQARLTLTLGAPKIGLVQPPAWNLVGRLEVLPEIGLIPCPFQGENQWILPADFAHFPPPRPVHGHKGTFGHAMLVAGSLGYHGAAVLATRGAARARPGLVTLFTQQEVYLPVASQLQAPMVHPWRVDLPENGTAYLFGPGLAALDLMGSLPEQINRFWQTSPHPVIVDASGLDFLQRGAIPSDGIRVMTPHPGEAGRLLECSTEQVQADRPAAVRALSARFGHCWVVLKGHQTLVGRSEGTLFYNSSGNPDLAQGGSGDLLAGYLTGLLAQKHLQQPEKTVCYAVWQHGAMADHLSQVEPNWTVEALAAKLGGPLPPP